MAVRPLRIALVEPLPVGGLLHYSTQLADALAARGHDVELLLARDNELAARSGPARRREILPREPPPPPARPSRFERTLRRARTALRLVVSWWRIVRAVRGSDRDVIVLGGSFDMALTAAGGLLVTRLRRRPPLAHVLHNVRPFNRWGGEQLYVSSGATIALLRRLYSRLDLILLHGERSREEFERSWPPARLAIIPHGDERLFGEEPPPPAAEPRVLFFGAWRKMKGLPVLMEAFELLLARMPDARLTIAGPTVPEEGESERVLAWAAAHAERVEALPGYVPVEEVRGLFARARVVVMPYLAGYQSGVLHLAMTMGRAVVASDVGDVPEVLGDGETGFIVPARDSGALALALERVLADPELAARLGAAAHERVLAGAGWDAVAEQLEGALRALLAESRSS